MNPLEARKQLLIAESEINRARLKDEIGELAENVHRFREQAGAIGSIATSSVKLLVGLAELRNGHREEPTAEHSWVRSILKGVGLVTTVWRTFRPRKRD
jgi:hypothetical protein